MKRYILYSLLILALQLLCSGCTISGVAEETAASEIAESSEASPLTTTQALSGNYVKMGDVYPDVRDRLGLDLMIPQEMTYYDTGENDGLTIFCDETRMNFITVQSYPSMDGSVVYQEYRSAIVASLTSAKKIQEYDSFSLPVTTGQMEEQEKILPVTRLDLILSVMRQNEKEQIKKIGDKCISYYFVSKENNKGIQDTVVITTESYIRQGREEDLQIADILQKVIYTLEFRAS